MSYAAYTDVQARFPYLTFGVSTKPSIDTVTDMIEEIEGEINAAMRAANYDTVPATDADDVNMLRGVVVEIVKARAFMIAFGDKEPAWVARAEARYTRWLERMADGDIFLPSQSPQSGVGAVTLTRREASGSEYT